MLYRLFVSIAHLTYLFPNHHWQFTCITSSAVQDPESYKEEYYPWVIHYHQRDSFFLRSIFLSQDQNSQLLTLGSQSLHQYVISCGVTVASRQMHITLNGTLELHDVDVIARV